MSQNLLVLNCERLKYLFKNINCKSLYSSSKLFFKHNNENESSSIEDIYFDGELPKNRIKKKFMLSTGPGGQNVNKINTKAEIRFNVLEAEWLPKMLRKHFFEKEANNINNENEWITTSTTTRSQIQNLEECYTKLKKTLTECSNELIAQSKLPTKEDLLKINAKQEQAEKFRRIEKDRRSIKRRNRQIF